MGVSGHRHAPATLPPEKAQYPLYRRLGGPQGWSGRLRKILPQPGIDPRNVQPVASRYTDWAIPSPHLNNIPKISGDTQCSRWWCWGFKFAGILRCVDWKMSAVKWPTLGTLDEAQNYRILESSATAVGEAYMAHSLRKSPENMYILGRFSFVVRTLWALSATKSKQRRMAGCEWNVNL
jgi:hypothetical protein